MNRRFKFTYQRNVSYSDPDVHRFWRFYVLVDDADLEALKRSDDEDYVSADVLAAGYAMDQYEELLKRYEGSDASGCKLIRMEQLQGIDMDGDEITHEPVRQVIDNYDSDDESMLAHLRWYLANIGNLTDAEIQYLLIRGGDDDDHSPEDVRADAEYLKRYCSEEKRNGKEE